MSTGKNFTSATKTSRTIRRAARISGLIVGGAGALIVAAGAVLPWTQFTVFGIDLFIPGVVGFGAATLAGAVLTLMRGRRWPIIGVLVGLLAIGIGRTAQQETGRAVQGRILGLKQSLGPVNDKLLRVGIPPIEPFPLGRRWADYIGPGPTWTINGGAILTVGSLALLLARGLPSWCPNCRRAWGKDRVVAFCPHCGVAVGPPIVCRACHNPLEPGDRFCVACATPAAAAPRP